MLGNTRPVSEKKNLDIIWLTNMKQKNFTSVFFFDSEKSFGTLFVSLPKNPLHDTKLQVIFSLS